MIINLSLKWLNVKQGKHIISFYGWNISPEKLLHMWGSWAADCRLRSKFSFFLIMLTTSIGLPSWIYLTLSKSIWTENILTDHTDQRVAFPQSTKEPDKNLSAYNRGKGKGHSSGPREGGGEGSRSHALLPPRDAGDCVKVTTSCWSLYLQRREQQWETVNTAVSIPSKIAYCMDCKCPYRHVRTPMY